MKHPSAQTLLNAFRHDRLLGAWLALFLLLVPNLHPTAKAMATDKVFAAEICSAFGQAKRDPLPAMADDCPMCTGGACAPSLGADSSVNPAALEPANIAFTPVGFSSSHNRVDAAQKHWLFPPGRAPPAAI